MTKVQSPTSSHKAIDCQQLTIRFAGDSGDGMQLTGDRFASISAVLGNDVITLADYPAEIRAPQGTLYGVSGYQLQIGSQTLQTPGDKVDILVAMNPAALAVNKHRVKARGLILVDQDSFTDKNLEKIGLKSNPCEDGSLSQFQLHPIKITTQTKEALRESPLKPKDKARCKNFFVLGLLCWLVGRTLDHGIEGIRKKFAKHPDIADANIKALKEGYLAGEMRELLNIAPYHIPKMADVAKGHYRFIGGNQALSLGLIAASEQSGRALFFASYPITPSSTLLHELSRHRNFQVTTYQAEDEIAAIGSALGASYCGQLAVTSTSGPGLVLKSEFLGLAVMTELPLVVIDVQRGGPSTGLPTKTEQSDLMMALWGRNGESPVVVLAASSPADCFKMAFEASKIAMKYMTPVILLSDAYIANGNEAWRIPDVGELESIELAQPNIEPEAFLPYKRSEQTLARPWFVPGHKGFEHRIGGLEKEDETGAVSQDPENHQKMVLLRQAKVNAVTQEIPATKAYGSQNAKFLVLSWGSTLGACRLAVNSLIDQGQTLAHIHLSYIHPFPKDLEEALKAYERILVPELNLGQLTAKLRAEFPQHNFIPFNQITGQPFFAKDIEAKIKELL